MILESLCRRVHAARVLCGAIALVALLAAGGPAVAAPIPGQYIVVLRDDADVATTVADHVRSYGAVILFQYRSGMKGYAARLSSTAASALRADPRVLFVTPDADVVAAGDTVPTGVARILEDEDGSSSPMATAPVHVAIIDTGIDANHPDLDVAGGVNCTNDKLAATVDPAGHGTLVAGVVGARANGAGLVGVAPGVHLWSVRVLKKNGAGSISGIICGIDWVTATRLDADPGNDVAVANMSLIAKGSDDGACGVVNKDALHDAICRSVAAGVTYVVAAGNDGVDLAKSVPAAYDEVLTVTAMTDLDGRSGGLATTAGTCVPSRNAAQVADDSAIYWSNFAMLASDQAHTLAAPGVCITSTSPGGGYSVASGTSFAAPHVAGTVSACIGSGACAGLPPSAIASVILADAGAYSATIPAYGFAGDPLHGWAGKYFGYLVKAWA